MCTLNYFRGIKLLGDLPETYAKLEKSMETQLETLSATANVLEKMAIQPTDRFSFTLSWDQDPKDERDTKYVMLFTIQVFLRTTQ